MIRRRLIEGLVCAGLLCGVSGHSFAQGTETHQKEPENTLAPWRVANTFIYAVLLFYFIRKYGPAFFQARTADIQKAIKAATGLKLEADFRYSEADRKMATLSQEIQRIREEYSRELDREHQRMRRDTEHEIERLHQNVQNEISAFQKDGMRQVRRRIAQAAIERAEQKLRSGAGPAEPPSLMRDFVQAVEGGAK